MRKLYLVKNSSAFFDDFLLTIFDMLNYYLYLKNIKSKSIVVNILRNKKPVFADVR